MGLVLTASKKMARNFLLWMIFIFLQVTYTLQDNETISGDSSETVDVASILALNDLAEETTITVSNDEDIKEYDDPVPEEVTTIEPTTSSEASSTTTSTTVSTTTTTTTTTLSATTISTTSTT